MEVQRTKVKLHKRCLQAAAPPPSPSTSSTGSLVLRVQARAAELGPGANNLLNSIKEVLLGRDPPPLADGEHAGLRARDEKVHESASTFERARRGEGEKVGAREVRGRTERGRKERGRGWRRRGRRRGRRRTRDAPRSRRCATRRRSRSGTGARSGRSGSWARRPSSARGCAGCARGPPGRAP